MDDLEDLYISTTFEIHSKKEWLEWGKQCEKLAGWHSNPNKVKGFTHYTKVTMPWEKIVRLLKLVKYPAD